MSGYEANSRAVAVGKVLASSVRKENGCLECGLTPSLEYPKVKVGGTSYSVHRLVYEEHTQSTIPDGMYTCHTCDNSRCVEINHLYAGTPKQNSADRELRGRSNPQSGDEHWMARNPEKIQRGGNHPRARITEQDVIKVRELYASGVGQGEIATRFGITRGYVSLLITRKKWAHVA